LSFFNELKRRNVFKVAIAYVIVAWLIAQVLQLVFESFGTPEWVMKTVLVLLATGLPIAIFFAWAFEMTPEGIKRENEVDRTQSITSQTGRKLNLMITAALVLALGYFAYDKFVVSAQREAALVESVALAVADRAVEAAKPEPKDNVVIDRSIAVLPFVNMSEDISNEYFSDGLSEELLNLLAKIPELKVASRSSAFQFKGEKIDIPVVAKQLNVAHVLEGSVRKSGNRIRITAQLIKADDGYHMWSETYDRTLDDVFVIQDEISAAVVDALKLALLVEAPKSAAVNADAYAAYLQGRYFYNQQAQEGWNKAVTAFQKSLAASPDYAPAWAALARAYADQADYGYINAIEGMALARAAVERALSLDPQSAPAWASLGYIRWGYDWNWEGAEEADSRALELEPGNVDVITQSARVKNTLGLLDESIELNQQAIALDPLSLRPIVNLGLVFRAAGRLDDAEAAYRQLLALNPQYPNGHSGLAVLLILKGQAEEALVELEMEAVETWKVFGLALAYHALVRRDEADATLASFIERYAQVAAYQIAEIYAFRNEADSAFEWLERAYEQRDGGMTALVYDELLSNLHTDARWEPLLAKIKLLDYWKNLEQKKASAL